jgi:dTDP-glucose pyrophosphorylase
MIFKDRAVEKDCSLLDCLKLMDSLDRKLLVVLENNKFQGLISAGDIQRAIIQNKSLDSPIEEILRKKIRVAKPEHSFETIKQMMFDFRMELCPVVDENQEVIKVYFWEDVFKENQLQPKSQFNLPVVIMAGGFGTRLKPITNVIPKPLIPIGEKTMLEHIFERFSKYGSREFHISVNYKADLIEFYLDSLNLDISLNYIREEKPMGTAGSLSLLRGKINQTFFVSNCDILIEQDYSEILDYHRKSNSQITIVAALKHYAIPYGTIETGDLGYLEKLQEKPELTFKINSGMYILEPELLESIPENEFFHITHLIEKVRSSGGKVGVFPVSEKSWKDVGEWDVYLKNHGIVLR